jgi:hypothetical protein
MMEGKRIRWWLLAAVLAGLCARIPGIYWGANFPSGWTTHHVDEYTHLVNAERMINPRLPPRWGSPQPYPYGMAAHSFVPMILWQAAQKKLLVGLPHLSAIITAGRIFAVLYGAASILLLYFLTRRLISDPRVAVLSAWFLALGGLHVTQSHFFLSDVPSLFWHFLALYLLLREMEQPPTGHSRFLHLGALSLGAAFGMKLTVFALPTLGLVALLRGPRFWRAFYSGLLFLAGVGIVNLGFYSSYDLLRTFMHGVNDPYSYSLASSLLLYAVEFPSIVSFPVALLGLAGAAMLLKRWVRLDDSARRFRIGLVVLLPTAINMFFVLFKLDHFPRHWIAFIPLLSIAAAYSLAGVADWLARRGVSRWAVVAPVFLYLAVFVYDGERMFWNEPRNKAAAWVIENYARGNSIYWDTHEFPGYPHAEFMTKPDLLVMEMHTANHFLSGMGWRDSYPSNFREVFGGLPDAEVAALQNVFRGNSEYQEVARFPEQYFMPEYLLSDRWIGNRSRNYLAAIVIFAKKGSPKLSPLAWRRGDGAASQNLGR